MVSLLGQLPGDREQKSAAQSIAIGPSVSSTVRPAAYWASWADALPMLQTRLPQVTANIVGGLVRETPLTGCLGELQESARSLDHSGFVGRCTVGPRQRTLAQLRRSPHVHREPLQPEITESPFSLDLTLFTQNLRCARDSGAFDPSWTAHVMLSCCARLLHSWPGRLFRRRC